MSCRKSPVFQALLILIFSLIYHTEIPAQCCSCNYYGAELVVNGNFSSGNTGFTTAYVFSTIAATGRYGITTSSNLPNPNYWPDCHDHTTGTGNLMWVDLSASSSQNVWTQNLNGLDQNKNYLFSCWVCTLDPVAAGTLQFSINGKLLGIAFKAPIESCKWVQFCMIWNSGSHQSATITITNQSRFDPGNDVGIDDISFRECTPSTFSTFAVNICQGNTFRLPGGKIAYLSGIYNDTLQSKFGCDSVVTTNLHVNPVFNQNISVSICAGKSYLLPGGKTVGISGIYTDSFLTFSGCDSIITTNVKSEPPLAPIHVNASVCEGNPYKLPGGRNVFSPGIYCDSLYTNIGCDSIIITNLIVFPGIRVSINKINASCHGSHDGFIQILATGGTPPFIYELKGSGKNPDGKFSGLSAGNYPYSVTDQNGCCAGGTCSISQPDSIIIEVHPADTTIEANRRVQIIASCNYTAASYFWSPGTFLSCTECYNPVSVPACNTRYFLTVSVLGNGKTCTKDTDVTIRIKPVIYNVNAFSPNDDGLNDIFRLYGNNFENIASFQIQIFNRWGEKMIESNDINFQWDGYGAQTGIYVYMIRYRIKNKMTDEPLITGTLSILK